MTYSGKSIWTKIASCFNGYKQAYIYLWISKDYKVIYVGQTNEKRGTFGRGYSHTQSKGTLRKRFEEEVGLKLEKAYDFVLVSYPLPQKQEYYSTESSYREAVEYLVQTKLRDIRGNVEPNFNLISKVRYNDRVSDKNVQNCAEAIIDDFQKNYSSS